MMSIQHRLSLKLYTFVIEFKATYQTFGAMAYPAAETKSIGLLRLRVAATAEQGRPSRSCHGFCSRKLCREAKTPPAPTQAATHSTPGYAK
jgi:hypothetical protein